MGVVRSAQRAGFFARLDHYYTRCRSKIAILPGSEPVRSRRGRAGRRGPQAERSDAEDRRPSAARFRRARWVRAARPPPTPEGRPDLPEGRTRRIGSGGTRCRIGHMPKQRTGVRPASRRDRVRSAPGAASRAGRRLAATGRRRTPRRGRLRRPPCDGARGGHLASSRRRRRTIAPPSACPVAAWCPSVRRDAALRMPPKADFRTCRYLILRGSPPAGAACRAATPPQARRPDAGTRPLRAPWRGAAGAARASSRWRTPPRRAGEQASGGGAPGLGDIARPLRGPMPFRSGPSVRGAGRKCFAAQRLRPPRLRGGDPHHGRGPAGAPPAPGCRGAGRSPRSCRRRSPRRARRWSPPARSGPGRTPG